MLKKERICSRCVMDTTDPGTRFDKNGVCSHCRDVEERKKHYPYNMDAESKKKELEKLVSQVKEGGKQKKYDCIIGVSGGVDSTYVIFQAKKMGLRP